MAPGLKPEEQEKTMQNLKQMMRRQASGQYRDRPAIPGKAESMLPGVSRVKSAEGDPVPFPDGFSDVVEPSSGGDRARRRGTAERSGTVTTEDFDEIAPGLSAEDRAKSQAAMDNLRRRQAEGDYRSRPSIPEKTDSMLPGVVVTRQAPGPAEPARARVLNYEHLQSRIRERVGPETVRYIVSMARDGRPIPTVLCLVQHPDGTVTVTRGDLRTIARPVLDAAGQEMRFADEQEACAWAWSDLEPGLGETPASSAADEQEALASGDRQRARMERRLREGKSAGQGTAS
ncbi:hypothetical protein [Microbacterium sp. Leaf203]|uniref:hypothetical protein n=1 Tax=Microbacterium sp. Leaf203 TaxID=1735677 RepID=UPI0006F3C000|nr:hypothetical protein [Microbacterium sp. Leaf203]KQM39269.1 hypothetical protein ASE56_02175 [Microbacterium sp. Leaf203]